jgi:hypothetical protein
MILALACNPDKDKDGIPDAQDKCPTQCAKTADGCPPEPGIGTVRLFLDRSGSMSGYYKGGSDFVKNIDDLIAEEENKRAVKEIWLVSDTAELFNGDADAFRDQLVTTPPKGAKSSRMDVVFRIIAEKTGSNDISMFVSDGILSYPDGDVKRNRNINKDKASELGNDIFTIFSRLRKSKNFGVSIYAFRSAFTGTYYNYRNEQKKLSGEERPYYIWAVGNSKQLRKFDAELARFSSFKPLGVLHFGVDLPVVSDGKFIPSLYRTGNWSLDNNGTGITGIGNEPVRFAIAVNLDTLPPYASQTGYLKEHIVLQAKSCTATLVQVQAAKDVDLGKLRSNPQKEDLAQATHVLVIEVKGMRARKASLELILPSVPDNWYEQWSCDDDLDLQLCPGRTFSFRYLIDGMAKAYYDPPTNYIDIPLALEQ